MTGEARAAAVAVVVVLLGAVVLLLGGGELVLGALGVLTYRELRRPSRPALRSADPEGSPW